MPVDVAMGFQYLLRTDQAYEQGQEQLMAVVAKEQEAYLRLHKMSFGD